MIALDGKSKRISLIDILVVLVMAGLLYYGASWQIFRPNTDAGRYQCYTQAFWHGTGSLDAIKPNPCNFLRHPDKQVMPFTHEQLVQNMRKLGLPSFLVNFVDAQSPDQPFHALPYEYPMLTLIPFTLAMFAPVTWFQVAYAFWMLVLAAVVYLVLLRVKGRSTAIVFALLLVVGGWATVAGRFDIIPAALSLFAVICADRKHWNWAFAFLALAVLYKYYPVMLLVPFLLVQQRDTEFSWKSWKRYEPFAVFVVLCAVVMGTSLALSVQGTISPFMYLGNRPIQVESLPASLLWVGSHLLNHPIKYEYTFGSLNMRASGASILSQLASLAEVVGVLYTFWLVWRRKMDLASCSLLIVMLLMVTGKVFSPQYIIWVIPLAAYVGGTKWGWVATWAAIGLLTSWIYPFIYTMVTSITKVPHVLYFFPATTVRNFLLAGIVLYLLLVATRHKVEQLDPSKIDEHGSDVDVAPDMLSVHNQ
jgi:hypothetical protein